MESVSTPAFRFERGNMRTWIIVLLLLTPGIPGWFFGWKLSLPTEMEIIQKHEQKWKELQAKFPHLANLVNTAPKVTEDNIPEFLDPNPYHNGFKRFNVQVLTPFQLKQLGAGKFELTRYLMHSDDMLQYCINHFHLSRKSGPHIQAFQQAIDDAANTRYLLSYRNVERARAFGKRETIGREVFLIDLEKEAIVGSAFLNQASHSILNRRMFEVFKIEGQPTYRPMFSSGDVRTRDYSTLQGWVIFAIVLLVLLWIITIPVALVIRKEKRELRYLREDGRYPETLPCPHCGKRTEHLKTFRTLKFGLFLGIAGAASMEHVTGCPPCARSQLRKRLLINLLPANLLMLFFGPMFIVQILRCSSKGHSLKSLRP